MLSPLVCGGLLLVLGRGGGRALAEQVDFIR
jgi:hypothetical protein